MSFMLLFRTPPMAGARVFATVLVTQFASVRFGVNLPCYAMVIWKAGRAPWESLPASLLSKAPWP